MKKRVSVQLARCLKLAIAVSVSSAAAQPKDATPLFPAVRFGMSPAELSAAYPPGKPDKLDSQRTMDFIYRTVAVQPAGAPVQIKFYFERTNKAQPWRLGKFAAVTSRDGDRDSQLGHWYQQLMSLYGSPRKMDDHGSGQGASSPRLTYIFCEQPAKIEVELARISNISFVSFEPASRRVQSACQFTSEPSPALGQQALTQNTPASRSQGTLPSPDSSLPSPSPLIYAKDHSILVQNLRRCFAVASTNSIVFKEKTEDGEWSSVVQAIHQRLTEILARDQRTALLNDIANERIYMQEVLGQVQTRYVYQDLAYCKSIGLTPRSANSMQR